MTVCGIKQADGVCVMGECPYVKMCCPTVWDKSDKPMTNDEWRRTCSTEEFAKWLSKISKFFHECGKRNVYPKTMYEEDWEWWLKEIHE